MIDLLRFFFFINLRQPPNMAVYRILTSPNSLSSASISYARIVKYNRIWSTKSKQSNKQNSKGRTKNHYIIETRILFIFIHCHNYNRKKNCYKSWATHSILYHFSFQPRFLPFLLFVFFFYFDSNCSVICFGMQYIL